MVLEKWRSEGGWIVLYDPYSMGYKINEKAEGERAKNERFVKRIGQIEANRAKEAKE